MSNLLILGSEGFLGKEIKKKIKKNEYSEIYSLDIKGRKSKKHVKSNINIFNIYNFINEYDISTIIDLIGCTNHNFVTKNAIQESLNKNFLDKKNIVKCLKKLNKRIKFITIGSLYKFGLQKKIKEKNFFPTNKSQDLQLIYKNKFEKKLFQINNKKINILVINIGSIYGNIKLTKIKKMNLIDQIVLKLRKKEKNTIYISKRKRFKNCIHVNDAASIILSKLKKAQFKYLEINIIKNIVNFNKFANKLQKRYSYIETKFNENINYYYYTRKLTKDYDLLKNFVLENVK
jgi:nucleoside-diphosphate-sugar epimerase